MSAAVPGAPPAERPVERGYLAGLRGRITRRHEAEDAAIAAAALRSDRFRQEREADWRRLEAIISRIERGSLRRLSDGDMLALPVLYRTVASSLSVARETSLDAATLAYLEALVQRAWFLVHGPQITLWMWLKRFFGGGWSRAVRALAPDIAIGLAVMVAGTFAGWTMVAADPAWFAAFVPVALAETREPGASRAVLRATLFGHARQDGLSVLAAGLFSHNSQIAILAFALGFAFGVPSLLLLAQNGGMLGAFLWLFHSQGLTLEVAGWLSIHGTTELFAVLLAGAAGLHIGRAIAFPGARSVLVAASEAGRRAALVMVGAVLMLLVAALLEGLARQLIEDTIARLAVGWGMLALWLVYFLGAGRGRENGAEL